MAPSVLDSKPSRVCNFPLTVCQQIWLSYVVPCLFTTVLYILELGYAIAVGLSLLHEHTTLYGIMTLCLVYAPALICYMLRLMQPPAPCGIKIFAIWFTIETASCILFPLRPIQCFAERLFWTVEVLGTSDPQREEALTEYELSMTRAVETHLFVNAYVHSLPQALLQAHLLITNISTNPTTGIGCMPNKCICTDSTSETISERQEIPTATSKGCFNVRRKDRFCSEKVQMLLVITSLTVAALTTASYHRYHSQIQTGRRAIWDSVSTTAFDVDSDTNSSLLPGTLRIAPPSRPTRRLKGLEQDNPIGKAFASVAWLLFLIARTLSLVTAAYFFPWVVLSACAAHYILFLLYILPSPKWCSSIPQKLLLSLAFVFCLIEVGIKLRKPAVLTWLFFTIALIEDIGITLLWYFRGRRRVLWFYYVFYTIIIAHTLSFALFGLYYKLFCPKVKRIDLD